ncbi:MAG: hypothetical protein JWP12_2330 [Bacteroidetes bacterium]|nr:hypothetical protein [Bacteroidota bacterium]
MVKQKSKKKEVTLPPITEGSKFAFNSFNLRALVLVIVGLILYSNSIMNEYALDDGIVIEKNAYVQNGFKGIPKILSTDAYESYYKQMNAKQQLSGGRYRPFSLVTFAIEQQLFGSREKEKVKDTIVNPKPSRELSGIRHFGNVVLYILSIVALFYFLLHFVFKDRPDVAFLTALIFLIHPMHTEVVANVKSRDEIFSFLFIVLTFTSVFKYAEEKKLRHIISGLVFYFLALLSKEYAVSLLLFIPMLLYIVKGDDFMKSLLAAAPYFVVAFIYLAIRYKIVGAGATVENTDVLNNPYMFATRPEKLATKIEVLDHYLRLMFAPYPLSSDYSYNTIPFVNFGNWKVWLSIAIHLSLIVTAVVLFFKRNIISFAITFYLVHLFLISNLKFDIGATMGERLVYHSSFGFAICLALFINWLLQKQQEENSRKMILTVLTVVLVVGSAAVVIPRNANWKNDNTLFITDAETVPNSALVNGNAGKAYVDLSDMPENKAQEKELLSKAMYHLAKSVSIHKKYVNGYLNLGVCYYKLGDFDRAKAYWDTAKVIFPNNPLLKRNFALLGTVYMNEALKIGGKDPQKAITFLEKAVACDPSNPDLWYNLGGACYTVQNYQRAREAWTQTLVLKQDYEQAKQGLAAIQGK